MNQSVFMNQSLFTVDHVRTVDREIFTVKGTGTPIFLTRAWISSTQTNQNIFLLLTMDLLRQKNF